MRNTLILLAGITASFTQAHAASCIFGTDTSKLYDAASAESIGLTYQQEVTIDKPDGSASIADGPNQGKAYLLSSSLKDQIRRTVARSFGTRTTLAEALKEMSDSTEAGALRFFSAPDAAQPGVTKYFVYINFYPGDNEYGMIFQIKNPARTVPSFVTVATIDDGAIASCSVLQ